MKSQVVAGAVVTDTGVISPGVVEFEGDRITGISSATSSRAVDVDVLVPGFIDLHCHGGGGYTFGTDDPAEVVRAHLKHGTTTLVASLITAPLNRLKEQVHELADAVDDGLIAGIHLEGPWLSHEFKGAHPEHDLQQPSAEDFLELWRASRGTIVQVTVAPELPGALQLMDILQSLRVTIAIGHSGADAMQTRAAIERGASLVTHAFNALRPFHHRDESLMNVALTDSHLTCELVLDGVHLSQSAIELVLAAKPNGWISVTDGMAAACKGDGNYVVGGAEVSVVNGIARLIHSGSIAGSTLTMAGAYRRLLHEHHLSPEHIAQGLSSRPAQIIGLQDKGVLRKGALADAVGLSSAGDIVCVWSRGRTITG